MGLTGDERYAKARWARLRLDRREPVRHRHQLVEQPRSVLPVDVVVLGADAAPRKSAALSGERIVKMLANVWQHANHVARYLSYYFSPNTHLTGEALGLFYAGDLFIEFKEAPRWRQLGARILITESQSQICADGVHFERSTCYHRYTLETYQHFLLLAARNGVPVPATRRTHPADGRVPGCRAADPMASSPEIGDADGGRCSARRARAVRSARRVRRRGRDVRAGDLAGAAEGMRRKCLAHG